MLEYALITALLSVAVIGGVSVVGKRSCITMAKTACAIKISKWPAQFHNQIPMCASNPGFAQLRAGAQCGDLVPL